MQTHISGDLNHATITGDGIIMDVDKDKVIVEWDLKTAVFETKYFRALAIAFELAEQMGEEE